MRYRMLILSVIMFLAACGGGGSPDATPQTDPSTPITAAPPPPVSDDGEGSGQITLEDLEALFPPDSGIELELPTIDPVYEGGLIIPFPGTLVASVTEDPLAGTLFSRILFTLRGGPEEIEYTLEIFPDGRIVRDGVEAQVSVNRIEALQALLDGVNFFGMQGTFLGPPRTGDDYYYSVLVEQADRERLINAQDGFIPQEFIRVLSAIIEIGEAAILSN